MLRASKSRKKHGLAQSIQNTWSNANTVSAYSRARVLFPKPDGATMNRATLRSRSSLATRAGRGYARKEENLDGRLPRHAD